jgi:hypothetical protein
VSREEDLGVGSVLVQQERAGGRRRLRVGVGGGSPAVDTDGALEAAPQEGGQDGQQGKVDDDDAKRPAGGQHAQLAEFGEAA